MKLAIYNFYILMEFLFGTLYFHFLELRGSVEHHLGNTALWGTGGSLPGVEPPEHEAATHHHLVVRLRIRGVTPPPPPPNILEIWCCCPKFGVRKWAGCCRERRSVAKVICCPEGTIVPEMVCSLKRRAVKWKEGGKDVK
jgi:hypothetical protein